MDLNYLALIKLVILINNNFFNENTNKKIKGEIKNRDMENSINTKNNDKEAFEKFVGEYIDDIYKDLEDQEIDKLVENIVNENEKRNSFYKFADENSDDIFDLLDKEEKK